MPLLSGDPFHRLTICGVFQRSLEVFLADPATFLKIGLIGAVPGIILNWLFLSKFADLFLDNILDPEVLNEQILETVVAMIGPLLLVFIFAIVVGIIIKVATIRSAIQIYVGKQPFLARDMKHGLRLFPRLCCLQFAFLCGIMAVALVVGIFTGVFSFLLKEFIGENGAAAVTVLLHICFEAAIFYFIFTVILWDTALVVEGLPEFQPFLRSYKLVKGQCCFVFCATFLEGLAILALFLVNHGLFGGLGPSAVAIAQSMTEVVLTPYSIIFLTVIYINSRIKREEECNSTVLVREMKLDSSDGTGSDIAMSQPEAPEAGLDAPLLDESNEPKEEPNAMV